MEVSSTDKDSSDSSLNLQLVETQQPEQDNNKWAAKLRDIPKDKIKFASSSSNSPLPPSRPSLDESIIIEDSPVGVKNISIIDVSDSSINLKDDLNLVLDESNNGTSDTPKHVISDSPMSEVLAPNNLLYQDCHNIDNVIDNDEDVQSMKEGDVCGLLDYAAGKDVR